MCMEQWFREKRQPGIFIAHRSIETQTCSQTCRR